MHDLEILLILCSSAVGDLIEPFTDMTVVNSRETIKGGEELIVTANACARNKATHGKVVDELVVEHLILQRILGGAVPFSTHGLRRKTASGSRGLEEASRGRAVAKPV
jgi:hypothetical protein